ncbi:PAS domain-containing protein [Daejeonella sp. JGW-45]|uniref:PAS domain-containing protein n=1 Tax=Daejeonella sp. JGW-45 TaxID=3034148 RepID=UPI0023EBA1EB|nr:PAS domain-containing protein [Daejeonella sp. JGW-45]
MQSKSFWIPVVFLLFGFLWAVTSEWGINLLYTYYSSVSPVVIRMLSRMGFVLLTGILLFLLISRSQRKLQDSDQQYRNLFFSNPNPMWIYQLGAFRIIEVNNSALAKYGYSRKEFLQMSLSDILPRDYHDKLVSYIEAGKTQIIEGALWKHKLKSGELITVSVATHRLTFNGLECSMVMITDVTQLAESKQQLAEAFRVERQLNDKLDQNLKLIERSHEESRKMAEVIDKVSNLVIIFNADHSISWVNKAFTEFTGYTLEESIGKTPGDLLTGSLTSAGTISALIEALEKRKFITTDIINYKKSGEPYWAELNISPIFDKEGEFEFFVSIETVINDRVEKQELLDRQYRAFREIAWTNSHEMRRPLATLLGLVDLLKQAGSEDERAEYIALLEKCSQELDQIIRDSALKINALEDEVNPSSE